jgi:hypothetical protein
MPAVGTRCDRGAEARPCQNPPERHAMGSFDPNGRTFRVQKPDDASRG